MTDPAIVRSPFGAEVDGRRLLGEAVGFGRALRAARLAIDLGAAVDFARALTLVDIGDREQVRAAGAAIFVRRRDDRAVYDAAFDRWWRRRGLAPAERLRAVDRCRREDAARRGGGGARRRAARGRRASTPRWRPDERGMPDPVRRRRGRRRGADRGRRHLARRLHAGRGPAPPRVRPDDPGRAARGGAAGRPAGAAARAPADAPLRAPLARPPAGAAGDVPAQPRDRRPAR